MVRIIGVLVLMLVLCGAAAAQSNLSVGAGVYAIMFDYQEPIKDFNYQGYTVTGTLALGPSSAVRGNLYFTEHEDYEQLTLNGFDAQFLLGSNLNKLGFKVYLLGGYWSETYEVDSAVKSDDGHDFSGLMAGFGLGYNWRSATLDLWGAWRQEDDYVDGASKSETVDLTVGSGALSFGIRF